MNRQLATRRLAVGTLIYKRIFPVFMAAAALVVAAVGAWNSATGGPASLGEVWPLVGVLVLGTAFTKMIAGGLADEVLDGGDSLIIRCDGIEERVPLGDIAQVSQSIWHQGPPRIELLLRTPGALGRVIAFIPLRYTLVPFARSPLFHELSARVERAQQETEPLRSRRTATHA